MSGGAAGGHGAAQVDRGGLGSVLRDLVKSGDENLREMNKKLQNMLEEQLTKNMHLHKVKIQRARANVSIQRRASVNRLEDRFSKVLPLVVWERITDGRRIVLHAFFFLTLIVQFSCT